VPISWFNCCVFLCNSGFLASFNAALSIDWVESNSLLMSSLCWITSAINAAKMGWLDAASISAARNAFSKMTELSSCLMVTSVDNLTNGMFSFAIPWISSETRCIFSRLKPDKIRISTNITPTRAIILCLIRKSFKKCTIKRVSNKHRYQRTSHWE